MIHSSNLNCGLSSIGKNKCWLKKKTRTENRKNSQKYTDDDVHFPPACKHLLWRPLAHLERQYEEEEQGRKNSRSCFSEHLYPAFACFLEKSWRRRCYNYLQEFLSTCPSQSLLCLTCSHTHWFDQSQWWQALRSALCYSAEHSGHYLSQSEETLRLFSKENIQHLVW